MLLEQKEPFFLTSIYPTFYSWWNKSSPVMKLFWVLLISFQNTWIKSMKVVAYYFLSFLIWTGILKGHWTSITSSPNFFKKKVGIFIPLEVLARIMTACWVLRSKLTYFWRNRNISNVFYFSKSTSMNTQYSSLWDTLKMMLFTKHHIKWKRIGRISWKFWYRFNLKSSTDLDVKR